MGPLTLHLHITARCLYRCPHCAADASPLREAAELGAADVKRLIDQLASLQTRRFDISGGDPLVRGKRLLLDVVSHARRKGLETSISTNGSRLTRDYAFQLREAGLHRIKFSLYGGRPQSHDAFTGVPGSFEKVIGGISSSKEAGLEVWVNAVVMPQNLAEMLHSPELLNPLAVDLVQISSVVSSGRGELAAEYRFPEQGLAEAIARMESEIFGRDYEKPAGVNYVFTNTMFPDPEVPPFEGRYCNNVVERLVIDEKGDVIPCCLLPAELRHSLGNIREADLSEICRVEKMRSDFVFAALLEGHEKLRQRLRYESVSHNLCTACGEMLSRLKEAPVPVLGAPPPRTSRGTP